MAYDEQKKRELLDSIYELMCEGFPVLDIYNKKLIEGLPTRRTFNNWVKEPQEFPNYARARKMWADYLFEEIQVISDTMVEGETFETGTTKDGDFSKTKKADAIEHRRTQIDARKFLVARIDPESYGNRSTIEVSNPALEEVKKQFPNFDLGERV